MHDRDKIESLNMKEEDYWGFSLSFFVFGGGGGVGELGFLDYKSYG